MVTLLARMTTFCLVGLCAVSVMLIYTAGAAHSQTDDDGRPGPPDPPPTPPEPDPPFDPDICVETFGVYTCPGMEEIERNDYTRSIDGVCTGDESDTGAQLRTCGFADEAEPAEDEPDDPDLEPEPDPDPEDPTPPVPVSEITRTEDYACDAPEPVLPPLDTVDFPGASINASPPGSSDWSGVAGVPVWAWADGDEQYLWAETEFGEEGFTVYARDGLYYPDDDRIEWGAEYPYEEAFWQCATYGFWYAEIVEWRWTLEGQGETVVSSGGQSGSEPNPYGDGQGVSAHLVPETTGNYQLTLETVWNGSWGDTWTTTHGPTDYEVREVISGPVDRD